jgi:thiamine biosynthesis lipoprotein
MNSAHLFTAFQFDALGTQVLFCSPAAEALRAQVRALVEAYEARFSRFRPSSEVETLSASAGRAIGVSEELVSVLTLAARFWRQTGGVFDPLVRPELEAIGYDRSFERVAADGAAPPAPRAKRAAFGMVELDAHGRTARLPAGARLDLGGIAKGWIVDRVADLLAPHGPFLVDIGGEVVARGRGPDGRPGWLVAVADPERDDEDLCWLRLDGRAIATSTTRRRRWRRGGRTYHHLIDPRTGGCAGAGLIQVSVVAPTTVEADVLAKTALILGPDEGYAWLAERGAPGLLVGPGGARATREWSQFALPASAPGGM